MIIILHQLIYIRKATECLFPSRSYSAPVEQKESLDKTVTFSHWIIRQFLKICISGKTLHRFGISSFASDPSETKRGRLLPPYGVNGYILRVICRGFFEKHEFHAHVHISSWTDVHVHISFIQHDFALLCWTVQQSIFLFFFLNLMFWPFSFTPLHTCICVMHWEEVRQRFIVEQSSNRPPAAQPLLLFLCRGCSLSSMWNYDGRK